MLWVVSQPLSRETHETHLCFGSNSLFYYSNLTLARLLSIPAMHQTSSHSDTLFLTVFVFCHREHLLPKIWQSHNIIDGWAFVAQEQFSGGNFHTNKDAGGYCRDHSHRGGFLHQFLSLALFTHATVYTFLLCTSLEKPPPSVCRSLYVVRQMAARSVTHHCPEISIGHNATFSTFGLPQTSHGGGGGHVSKAQGLKRRRRGPWPCNRKGARGSWQTNRQTLCAL